MQGASLIQDVHQKSKFQKQSPKCFVKCRRDCDLPMAFPNGALLNFAPSKQFLMFSTESVMQEGDALNKTEQC